MMDAATTTDEDVQIVTDQDAILSAFGQAVRDLRRTRNWTQAELAERAETHRVYLGAIERGEKNIGLITVRSLANAFGIKTSELLELAQDYGL